MAKTKTDPTELEQTPASEEQPRDVLHAELANEPGTEPPEAPEPEATEAELLTEKTWPEDFPAIRNAKERADELMQMLHDRHLDSTTRYNGVYVEKEDFRALYDTGHVDERDGKPYVMGFPLHYVREGQTSVDGVKLT